MTDFKPMTKPKKFKNLPIRSKNFPITDVDDALALYLKEISQYTILTKQEEHELTVKYFETKDVNVAKKLVTSNLRFVVKIAMEYSKFEARIIDLIQEGNLGLMHALKAYDPHKGVRLITYAVWWIRGYIREYLMRNYSQIKIGTTNTQRKLFYRLNSEIQKLENQGLGSNIKLLSEKLHMPEEDIKTMKQRLSKRDISLDQPINDDSKLVDFQVADTFDIDEKISSFEEAKNVRKKLENLRPQLNNKEKDILDLRLLSQDPLTLQELGNKHGVTRERTRQIEKKLLEKIKTELKSLDSIIN